MKENELWLQFFTQLTTHVVPTQTVLTNVTLTDIARLSDTMLSEYRTRYPNTMES